MLTVINVKNNLQLRTKTQYSETLTFFFDVLNGVCLPTKTQYSETSTR